MTDVTDMLDKLEPADVTPIYTTREPFCMQNNMPTEPVQTDAKSEYYWSWDPWTSHLRENPAVRLFTGNAQVDEHNQYTGDFLQIGQVIHASKGTNNRTNTQVQLARKALYPQVRSKAYEQPLRVLNEIELSIGTGRVFS